MSSYEQRQHYAEKEHKLRDMLKREKVIKDPPNEAKWRKRIGTLEEALFVGDETADYKKMFEARK